MGTFFSFEDNAIVAKDSRRGRCGVLRNYSDFIKAGSCLDLRYNRVRVLWLGNAFFEALKSTVSLTVSLSFFFVYFEKNLQYGIVHSIHEYNVIMKYMNGERSR